MTFIWSVYYPDFPNYTFPETVKRFARVEHNGHMIDCNVERCPACKAEFAVPFAITAPLGEDENARVPCPGCGIPLVV